MQEYFLGQSVAVKSTTSDATGVPVTPSSITVVVLDPTGAPVTATSPAALSTGVYQSVVSPSTLSGVYTVTWTSVVSSFTGIDKYEFFVRSTVPLVSVDDLSAYLNATADPVRADLLLNAAQSLCEAILTPLPPGAAAVILDVAARAYSNPQNMQAQTAGPYSASFGAVSGGLWLTQANKATLRLLGGGGGAFTIDTMPATAGQGLSWWDTGVTPGWF